jgi:hypothetical protein
VDVDLYVPLQPKSVDDASSGLESVDSRHMISKSTPGPDVSVSTTVLRNDLSGSGGEGAFDVCAAKRPEVNESCIGRRQRQAVEFDLATNNRLAWQGQFQRTGDAQISPSWETFPLRLDRGRKDSKESRVVEKECALGAFPSDSQMTVTGSPHRRVGEPRTAFKYPRGDHPSPTGSCVLGLPGPTR